ncbi:MAG TPA: DMT family transporter [Acidiferrobacterales bacterium]|nr:DMT family transporter [Acidiferrobacterales bacterium]
MNRSWIALRFMGATVARENLISRQLLSATSFGYCLAIVATALWAGNFVIARGFYREIPPIGLAFWRWVIAVAVLIPFTGRSFIEDWPIVKRHLGYLSITALLGITVFNTVIYAAGHTAGAAHLSLIAVSAPVFMVFLSRIFFGEPVTPAKTAGILIAATGVLTLIVNGSLVQLRAMTFAVGDIWMIGAAAAFAGYSALVKRIPSGMRMRTFLSATFALGLLFLLPFYLWERVSNQSMIFDKSTVLALLYVGILASVVAFIAWNRAIAIIGPYRASIVYYLLPVFSAIAASFFLGEKIGAVHVFSMVLIIFGIFMANR